MSNKLKYFIIFLFSVVFTLTTVLISKKSNNNSNVVYFGYPIGFISQDFSSYDPISYYQTFYLNREGAYTNFLFFRFLLSLSIVFFSLKFVIYVLEFVYFFIFKYIYRVINKFKLI